MPQHTDEERKKNRTLMERIIERLRGEPKDEVLNRSEQSQLNQLQGQEARERLLQEEAERRRRAKPSLLSPDTQ